MQLVQTLDRLENTQDELRDSLDMLGRQLAGELVTPGHPAYDQGRHTTMFGPELHPLAIVRPAHDADVSTAITFARERSIPISVRSGGHSLSRHGVVSGALVIDLSSMKGVRVDPVSRLAHVQGGATTADVAASAHEYGLALSTGDTATVGIGGLTTGGGIGLMARSTGLAIDNLVSARVVLADGSIVTASAIERPDLFWAIRGGGGNFGVVSEFTFHLAPVSDVVGGMLILPATREVLRGYADAAVSAPEQLTTIANLMRLPPLPNVPEDRIGDLVLGILVCWNGEAAAAEDALAPLRSLAEPVMESIGPLPYPHIFAYTAHQTVPHGVAFRSMFADHLSDELLDDCLEAVATAATPFCAVQFRGLGGAIARVDPYATAFAHRTKQYLIAIMGAWLNPEEDSTPMRAWTESLWARVQSEGDGAYVNFLAEEGEERVRDAYGDTTYERLRKIKAIYDPGNVFNHNQNITPATA